MQRKAFGLSILLFFITLSSGTLTAREIDHYGRVELNTSIEESGKATDLSAGGFIDANHRLSLTDADFYLHHEVEVDTEDEIDYVLHEAYLVLYPYWGNLTFGRHRIPWGTGIFFSPTDAIHPVSLSGEAETGFDGLSGTFVSPNGISLTAALSVSPALDFAEAAEETDEPQAEDLAARLRPAASVSGYIGTLEWRTSLVYQLYKVFRPGISLSADLAGYILSLEGAIEMHNSLEYLPGTEDPELWDRYPIWAAGMEKSWFGFSDTFTIVGEYLSDSRGYDAEEADLFYTALAGTGYTETESAVETPALGRQYLNVSAEYSHDNTIFTEHGLYMNLQDSSGAVVHSLTYTLSSGIDFILRGTWTFGDSDGSEFGLYSSIAGNNEVIPSELSEYTVTARIVLHL